MSFTNQTPFFLLTLLLHVVGILVIANQTNSPINITLPELELSAVELNLSNAAEDSLASPPPQLNPASPEPEKPVLESEPEKPVPEPVPEKEPEKTAPEPEPEQIALPEDKPPTQPPPPEAPQPTPPELKPEPDTEPEPQLEPTPEPAPEPPPPTPVPQAVEPNLEEMTEHTQPDTPKPVEERPLPPQTQEPEMLASETPESGAASAQVDVPPRPRTTIKPVYPAGARRRGEEGSVTLSVRISVKGEALRVEITKSSGFPELDQAAKHAVQKAQFAAGKIDSKPVESSAGLTIIFNLR